MSSRSFTPIAQRPTLLLLVVAMVVACSPVDGAAMEDRVASGAGASSPVTAAPSAQTNSAEPSEPAATHAAEPRTTPSALPSAVPSDAGGSAGAPSSAAAASATPQRPFAMNLYRKGDFVAQYTFEWCVGASLQMALNLTTDEAHTSRADQERLWQMARDRSSSPFGGANPTGWTATLNELGIGPFRLVSIPTMDEALAVAAEAIRATRRPVGLVMWHGRHAWVMTGFAATADPRRSDDFDVTGVNVLDPLYPHGSETWGPSPKPNTLVSPATLAKQFVVRDVTRSRVDLGVPSGYLMILPIAAQTG